MLGAALGLLATLVGVATVWLVRTRPVNEQDPDAGFWLGFSGFCVLAPLAVGAASMDRWAAVAVFIAVPCSCVATGRLATRSARRKSDANATHRLAAEHAALMSRHDRVLRQWSRYELEPDAALAHPGMNDVNAPETAALAGALAAAEQLRRCTPTAQSAGSAPDYRQAVIRLEAAFRQAERAQG